MQNGDFEIRTIKPSARFFSYRSPKKGILSLLLESDNRDRMAAEAPGLMGQADLPWGLTLLRVWPLRSLSGGFLDFDWLKVPQRKTPQSIFLRRGASNRLGVRSLRLSAQRVSFPLGLEPPLDKVGGTITGPDAYCPLWIPKRSGYEIAL